MEAGDAAIRAYKAILAAVIDQRPSGTRQRLADALGKNRSFVTQITSPAYATPLPARHISTIFAVCHFAPAEREHLLAAYERAHPGRVPNSQALRRHRTLSVTVPDLGDEARNGALDRAVAEFVHKIAQVLEPEN